MRQLHLFLILALGEGLYDSVGRFDLTWINLIMAQTRDIPASVNLPGKLTLVRRNETLAPVRNTQTSIY